MLDDGHNHHTVRPAECSTTTATAITSKCAMTTIKGQQSGYTAIGNSKGVTLVVPTINMDGEMVQFDFAMDKIVAVQLIEALQDAVKVHDISVKAKSSNE